MRLPAGRLASALSTSVLVVLSLGAEGAKQKKGADYYAILDVPRNADVATIKKAYRTKSLEFHPDKCELDKDVCQAKFIEISTANEVLNDAEKRKIYDRDGEEGLKEGGASGGEQAKQMFRQYFGREPDGEVKIVRRGGRMMFEEMGEPGPEENIFDDTNVTELADNVFKSYVHERDEPWLINFYKPNNDDSVEIKGEFIKFADTFRDFVKVGAVNCRQQREICSEASITDWPAMRWFPENKDAPPEVWDAGTISAKSLGRWASGLMPDNAKVLEDKRQLREWMDSAKGPAIILFTDKTATPPMWKALSREFQGRASFAVVRGCDKTGVFKTPLQREFDVRVPGVIRVDPLEAVGHVAEKFDFQLKKDVIHLWTMKAIAQRRQSGPQATFKEWSKERYDAGDCGPADSQICFLWFKLGADPAVEEATRQLAHKYRTDPVKMMWANVEINPELLDTFGLDSAAGTDFFVAFRPKRGKFRAHDGGLAFPELDGFVEGVLNGGPMTERLKANVEL